MSELKNREAKQEEEFFDPERELNELHEEMENEEDPWVGMGMDEDEETVPRERWAEAGRERHRVDQHLCTGQRGETVSRATAGPDATEEPAPVPAGENIVSSPGRASKCVLSSGPLLSPGRGCDSVDSILRGSDKRGTPELARARQLQSLQDVVPLTRQD